MYNEVHCFLRYHEVCDYSFHDSKPNSGKVTGHFTQVVWKPSKEFGIGYATGVDQRHSDVKCVYVVARYKPAGNILGQFSTNVGGRVSDRDNICSEKINKMASESNQGEKVEPWHGIKNNSKDLLSSNVLPEQGITKLYEDDSMMGRSEEDTGRPQGSSLTAPSATELYESRGENMPANVADELPTRLEEESTQVANTAKLYETNGNNMEVPSDTAREVSGLMDDIGLASKQQTSEVQSGMNSDMSPDTTPASMVPLNTDGINVPSQQESSLTPPEMSSAAVSQEMPSVEDTAAVKTPLPTATSASQAVPSTVAAPPVSNVVAPVASGKPPTPSGSPVVTAQSPVATPATSIKPVKEECKDHIVFLNIKLFYNISFSVNKDN